MQRRYVLALAIVAAIGVAESHKDVLEQPDKISKTVLAKGLLPDGNVAASYFPADGRVNLIHEPPPEAGRPTGDFPLLLAALTAVDRDLSSMETADGDEPGAGGAAEGLRAGGRGEEQRRRAVGDLAGVARGEQAALLDKSRDAILVLDLSNRCTYWNKSAEALYGSSFFWSFQIDVDVELLKK